ALEHFDGDEERKGSIDAAGSQDKQNVVPMKSAGNNFLADQAGAENGDESKLRIQLEAREKRGNSRYHYDESHRCKVTLGFLVTLGEQSDGQKGRGEKHGQGERHEEHGQNCRKADVQLEGSRRVFLLCYGARVGHDVEGCTHGNNG